MDILDISVTIDNELPFWPDSTPHGLEWVSLIDNGAPANASCWTLSAHTGTHIDAPRHFIRGGSTIDRLEIDRFYGPCQVMDFSDVDGHISACHLNAIGVYEPRILIRTRNSLHRWWAKPFTPGYVGLTEDGADFLIESGVILVGTDYLSIEPFDSIARGARTHHKLLGAGVPIVEGLRLADVVPGRFVLSAFPLKLGQGDAAPVRACLISKPTTSNGL